MKKLLALITAIVLFLPQVILADFEPADDEENASNTFILDADDTGGDITLQFGASLAEFLKWNSSTLSFDFSDETLVLDSSNTGVGANVNIVANQGSDNDGTLRYNATTNQWEISNDGGGFNPIAIGTLATALPVVQVRQAGGYTLSSATWADITFDTTDLENDSAVLEHNNTLTDRIDVKEDGIYMITYNLNLNEGTATGTWDSRVILNDTTPMNGSVNTNSNYQNEYVATSATFYANLTASDFITLQAQRSSANNLTDVANPVMTITKMEGIKGADGANGTDGVDGVDGADGAQGPPGPAGSGTTLNIQEEGAYIPNTPHSILNFVGSAVTATDAGGGIANITITSSGADFESVYATDADKVLTTGNGAFSIATGSGALNINTGTSTSAVSLGGNLNTFAIDTSTWDISAAGAAAGFTGMTSTGTVDFSGASSFRLQEGAANPGTCTKGQLFFNTTTNYLQLCTATNTWTPQGRRVPDMNNFVDTTADGLVSYNNTTNYWDGTTPNITPIATSSEILVMGTITFDPNSTADVSVVTRIDRNIGSAPTCGSATSIGQVGFFTSDNDIDGASFIFVDTPATTNTTYYTLCSDVEGTDSVGNILRIEFTLYEMNDGADLAEIYSTKDITLKPGEVVSLDPTLTAGVKRSSKAYDSKVFGVISTKPAQLIGNTKGEGVTGIPVALSGRVPVKVNTENGPIKPGDLLTPSSVPGVAMKATKPGYIIGRAFNGYSEKETGVILLFVDTSYADPTVIDD